MYMLPTDRHHTVEAHFRELTDAQGIPPPDRVDYRAASVVFFWDGPHVAVVVDFDDVPERPRPTAGARSGDA
jgi:hypothetical protein